VAGTKTSIEAEFEVAAGAGAGAEASAEAGAKASVELETDFPADGDAAESEVESSAKNGAEIELSAAAAAGARAEFPVKTGTEVESGADLARLESADTSTSMERTLFASGDSNDSCVGASCIVEGTTELEAVFELPNLSNMLVRSRAVRGFVTTGLSSLKV
jgi:hypothetical protein